ncbi:MAG: hypothetical protein R3330_16445, partial [Saprospiraceae bacterium]|nr:hypothetical protein [Saprospiraceae bacterium]
RGFWIMDDLSILHQDWPGDEVTLFKPKDAYRSRFGGGRSSGDGPRYLRPGMHIDYFLPAAHDGGIRLDILDARGAVVRTLVSSDEMVTTSEEEEERDMATGLPAPSVIRALEDEPGLHRYRWDMRHTGAWHSSSSRRFGGGPLVVPGTYIVRLTTGTEVKEQSFTIHMDPDVAAEGATMQDLQQQERLSLDVAQLLSRARILESDLRKQLKSADDDAAAAVQASLDKLVTSAGRYQQPMLISQISYLYGILTRADQLPGQDAVKRFGELKEALDQLENSVDR